MHCCRTLTLVLARFLVYLSYMIPMLQSRCYCRYGVVTAMISTGYWVKCGIAECGK